MQFTSYESLTLETLPKAFAVLMNEVNAIKEMIVSNNNRNQPDTERWFNIDELCEYLPQKPAKQTVYLWIQNKDIPHYKRGKKLQFLKSEIDNWIKEGRKKTMKDVQREAEMYINNSKGEQTNV